MNDLQLWRWLDPANGDVPDAVVPLLHELATRSLAARAAFMARVLRVIADPRPAMREAALAVLAGAQGYEAIRAIVDGLADGDEQVRQQALASLQVSCGQDDPARLVHAFFARDVGVRRAALAGPLRGHARCLPVWLLDDPQTAAAARATLPEQGLEPVVLPTVLDMVRTGTLPPDVACDVIARIDAWCVFVRLAGGYGRDAADVACRLAALGGAAEQPTPQGLETEADAFDAFIDLLAAAPQHDPAAATCERGFLANLADADEPARSRVALAAVRRLLLGGSSASTMRILVVALPEAVTWAWLPAPQRRAAGIVFSALGAGRPRLATGRVLALLEAAPIRRPSGTLDLRLVAALASLTDGLPLEWFIVNWGLPRIAAAFDEDLLDSAPFAGCRAEDAQGYRDLVAGLCGERRPRIPPILAALLPWIPRDAFDVVDALSREEAVRLLIALRARQHGERWFGPRRTHGLAQRLADVIAGHDAGEYRAGPRSQAALAALVRSWARGPAGPADALFREVVLMTLWRLPADASVATLVGLDDKVLAHLLGDSAGASLPHRVDGPLRRALRTHADPRLRVWAAGVRADPPRPRIAATPRALSDPERERLTHDAREDLVELVESFAEAPTVDLTRVLAPRGSLPGAGLIVAEALLIAPDPLETVDACLAAMIPTGPQLIEQIDVSLASRCPHSPRVGLAAHLWLAHWERHLEVALVQLAASGTTLAELVRMTLGFRYQPFAARCLRAVALALDRWRFRDERRFREQATSALAEALLESLPGKHGLAAARMLVDWVRLGGEPLLATLRWRVMLVAPDLSRPVRDALAEWIDARGLAAPAASASTEPLAATRKGAIGGCHDVALLVDQVAGDDAALAEEAVLRLVELGRVERLVALLEREPAPPHAAAIAASLAWWPEGGATAQARRLVRSGTLPPAVQIEAILSLLERGDAGLEGLAIAAITAPAATAWFRPAHWQRLVQRGCDERRLALVLAAAPHPHAQGLAVVALLTAGAIDAEAAGALAGFLELGDESLDELRVEAARRLHEQGDARGLPLLVARETQAEPVFPQLFARLDGDAVADVVRSCLAAGPVVREAVLLTLVRHPAVDPAARTAGLLALVDGVRSADVRTEALRHLRRTRARQAVLEQLAEVFAWGVRRGLELSGRLFAVELIGADELGYTRLDSPRVFVSPAPILRRLPHGTSIVRGLIMHEIGHHLYHGGPEGMAVWKQAAEEGLTPLLNLVADEHLERNLRATDPGLDDPLKRLAALAFQHASRSVPVIALLESLQGGARALLERFPPAVAARPGHVGIRGGAMLRELDQDGRSFARFVRSLRMGLGNRHGDPRVDEALALFAGTFRHATMPELLEIARRLRRIFGAEVELLETLGQDSLAADGRELAEREGITSADVQRHVERLLDRPASSGFRSVDPRGAGRLSINVDPEESFSPIDRIERVPFDADAQREFRATVRRPAAQLRRFFAALGLGPVVQRRRLQGRAFDRGRAVALAVQGEPRVLVSRRLEPQTDLFLGLGVDCSGSMENDGNLRKARAFAELLAAAAADVPGIDLRIFGYTDRVLYDAGDARRSSAHALESGGGNNDAAALWHLAGEALRSRRRSRLLVMISDGLPTECSAAALRALVERLTRVWHIGCAQVAVRPLEEICFRQHVLLDQGDLDASVRGFGRLMVRLVQRSLQGSR